MRKNFFFFLLGLLLLSPLMLHAKSNPFVEGGIKYYADENNRIWVRGLVDKTLTHIEIPARRQYPLVVWRDVMYIDTNAFLNETGIVSVTLPNTINEIWAGAFENCTALTSINIPESVRGIKVSAFSGCTALVTLNVPNNVTTIQENAFKNVFNVTYNGSATGAPWGAKHLNAYVEDYIAYESAAKTKIIGCHPAKTGQVDIPSSVTEIAETAFVNCGKISSVRIPNSVKKIGEAAFMGCTALKSVTLSSTLTSIGDNTFRNTGLTSITIPSGVTEIGVHAFLDCTALTSVTLPSTLTSIGDNAFRNTGLTSITIPSSVTKVGNTAFLGCRSLTTVVWNAKNCADFSSSVSFPFYSCNAITSFTFGSSVETIPAYLCYDMDGLTNITLSNRVKTIGKSAFRGCGKLSAITIPSSVTSVGNTAFCACSALKTVVWNVKNCADFSSYSDAPFYSSSAITSFTFGSSVETIPAYLCYGMSKLTGITLPKTVRTIGTYAFAYCSGLTSITTEAAVAPACGYLAFSSVPTTIPVNIPCGSLDSYQEATGWKNFTNLTEPYFYAFELQTADAAMGAVQFDQPFTCASEVAYFSAVPAMGYHFTQWSDGNTDNPRTLTLTKDMTLTAEFAINQYTLTVLSDNEEQGTAAGGKTADYNTTVEISATAKTGYHFVQWSDGNNENPRTVTVTGDATYTAQFAANQYTITVATANEAQGTAAGGTTADYNTTVEISATAKTGYHFVQWSDGNPSNPRSILVSQDETYTAQFAPNQYTLTVLSDDEEQGTVTGGTTADYLTEITITATPAAGYKFVQWSDGNTENPRIVTLTEDTTVTALFRKDEQTGLENTTDAPVVEKFVRNNQVLIRRNGRLYTVTGQEIAE